MLINTRNALALINVTTEHGEQRNNYCVAKNVDHRQNHCPKETKANQDPSPNSKKDRPKNRSFTCFTLGLPGENFLLEMAGFPIPILGVRGKKVVLKTLGLNPAGFRLWVGVWL